MECGGKRSTTPLWLTSPHNRQKIGNRPHFAFVSGSRMRLDRPPQESEHRILMEKDVKFVLSILVADHPGIMCAITSAITDQGGNINGIRQTVVEGYFSIILTATFAAGATAANLHAAVTANFPPGEASIVVRPYAPVAMDSAIIGGTTYILVIAGPDRPGILRAATGCLANHGVNIEDWSYHFDGPQVTYIGVLTVPRDVAVAAMQDVLRATLAPLEITCSLQHENIFRATSEIGPVKSILEGRHAT